VLRLDAPVHKLDIKYRAGFVFLTGPVTLFFGHVGNVAALAVAYQKMSVIYLDRF
jgi:hypothetical protein